MAKKKKTRRDTAELARDIVEQVTGGKLNGDELDEQLEVDKPITDHSRQRKGGESRAKNLSADRRREIARQAAKKRWEDTQSRPSSD